MRHRGMWARPNWTAASAAIGAAIGLVGCAEMFESSADGILQLSYEECPPLMTHFPVGDAHNIGYDHASCGSGTCEISCPDAHANSDYGGDHHGIDIFAYQGAPLTAVASGEIVAVGTPSSTSGLRVRLRDACGWEYYYGHMDTVAVAEGDEVRAGDFIGTMGYTGAASTHLHFNVSWDGDYSNDINPFDLLNATSGTACDLPVEEIPEADSGANESEPSETETPASEEPAEDGSSSEETSGSTPIGDCGWATGTTYLWPGEHLASCDERFSLNMQTDGNLVLRHHQDGALWQSHTYGTPGAWAAMQTDGNLVVYSNEGRALWASGTSMHPGAALALQNDGNLVIYDGHDAVWHTRTHWY